MSCIIWSRQSSCLLFACWVSNLAKASGKRASCNGRINLMLISTEKIWWLAGQMSFCFAPISGPWWQDHYTRGRNKKWVVVELTTKDILEMQVSWWHWQNLTNLWQPLATLVDHGQILWRGEASEVMVSDRLDRPKGVSWQHQLTLSLSTGQFNGRFSIWGGVILRSRLSAGGGQNQKCYFKAKNIYLSSL